MLRNFVKKSIHKVAIVIGLITILLLGIIGNLLTELYEHKAYEHLENNMQIIENTILNFKEDLISELKGISTNKEIVENNSIFSNFFNLYIKSDVFSRVLLIDNKGNINNIFSMVPTSFTNNSLIDDLEIDLNTFSEEFAPYAFVEDSFNNYFLILPIDQDINNSNILVGEINLDFLENQINKFLTDSKQIYSIVNKNGEAIIENGFNSSSIVTNNLFGKTKYIIEDRIQGAWYRCLGKEQKDFSWYLICSEEISLTHFFLDFSSRMIFIFVFLILAIFAIEFLTYKKLLIDLEVERKEIFVRQEKIKVVSQLAATVAHEVRNPLTSIKGFMQLAKRKGSTVFNSEVIDVIEKDLERIELVITEFLQLSRPHVEKKETINLQNVIREILVLIEPFAILHNVLIYERLETVTDIQGDKNLLKQAFINLLKNAIEAKNKREGFVEVNLTQQENKLIVSIKDNGKGMPQEILDNLGTPFYTTKPEGTGLGLTVVYSAVEKHEGSINIQSWQEKGTEFTITIPIKEK